MNVSERIYANSRFHDKAPSYPVDVYIAYSRSMYQELERRVIETPPRRPAEFWRMADEVQKQVRFRMRKVSG